MPTKDDAEHVSQTFLGLRLEKWLEDAIEQCARQQHRSKSNWVRIVLERAVERQLSGQ